MSVFMWRLGTTALPILVVGATVVWLAYSVALRRHGSGTARLAAIRALLAVGVATLLWWTLILSNPSAPEARSLNLVPLREISRALQSAEPGYGVVNLWGNILIFVPIGALALLSMHNRTWTAMVLAFTAGVGLSVAIEAAQYAIGRSADVDDIILNTMGIAIGVLGARLALRVRRRAPTPDSRILV